MKKNVLAGLFAILLLSPNFLLAQSSVRNYNFASTTGTYIAISGTNSTAAGDDGVQNGIPIGFNFFYGGRGVTHFCIATNGFIKLGIGTTTISTNNNAANYITNDPSPAPFYPLIAAFWDNNHRNNGSISYVTTGAVGSRVLTVQWDGINIGSGITSPTLTASFQIKLFEGTNIVKIIYSTSFANAGAITASIGLNDATSFLSITPGIPATASSLAANNAIADLSNITGKEYTFTPQVPLCSPVNSLAVSNISSSGALLTVNTVSGATGYRYSISTTADYPTSSTLSANPTFTLSGLLPNTTYYAQAQAVCSGGNSSAWFTTAFNTSCATLTVPYFQNFDTVVAPVFPSCMSKEDLNGGASWATSAASSAAGPYSAPNCLVYGSDPAIAGNDWFYTPSIALTSGVSYRLSFYYKNASSASPEKLEVKYGNANNAGAMANLIFSDANITNTSYNVLERNFTPSSSGAYYIGFHNFSNANQLALNIDDIRLEVAPTCGAPTLLSVSMTTPASGIASWTAPTVGAISGYQYAVNTTGVAPASGTAVATTSVNLTGLTEGLQYYLHVRTVCGTNSSWARFAFYTPCSVKQVPYFENFDTDVVAPALKTCYTVQDLNGGTTWASSTDNPRSASNCMRYSYDAALPGNDWFFTPPIRLQGGVSYKISYYNRAGTSSFPEKLEVKYGTANNAAAMANLLTTNANLTATTYQLVSSNFTPGGTGDYYFGFHAFSDADQLTLHVDDIRIEVSTDCGVPTGLSVVSSTASSGTASWLPPAVGTVSSYQYAVTSSASPPESGTNTTTPNATFSGLQPATQYYLHVKSSCAAGLFSAWVSLSFTTPCGAVDIPYTENFNAVTTPSLPACMSKVDVNGGTSWVTDAFGSCVASKAMMYAYDAALPGDDWAFTPGLNLTAGVRYELTFNYLSCSGTKQEKLEVKYGNGNAAAAMSNVIFSNLSINQTTYQPARVSFVPAASGVYFIGFHSISSANQYRLYIDDIKVDVSTFCGQPVNPGVTLSSNTSGTVKWSGSPEGTPSSYQYAFTTNNIPPASGTVVTDTAAAFSGLLASTRYFLHVRSVCTNGNTSEWASITFTTGCVARNIPYAENFDNVVVPYLGNCMALQDLNGGSTWKTDTYKPRSAPNSMLYRYNEALPGNDWAYTPGLNLLAGIKYRLSFYYKARGYNERLEVKWGGAASADSMTLVLWDNIFNDSTTYRLAQVDFTAPRTGVFYIGFHSLSVADQWDLNVDDISVDYAPGCGVPRNLAINMASATAANVSWVAPLNGPATGYEFATSTYNAVPPSSGQLTTTLNFNMVGLLQGVKYYVFVRTACAAGAYSATWAVDSLYIPCTARNVPYSENFDAVLAPVLAPCITTQDLNGGTTWNTSNFQPRSAPNCMNYRYNTNLPGNDWFYLAPLNFTAGAKYRLAFYYKARSSGSVEKLRVKYGNANNAVAMSTEIFVDSNITSTNYLKSETDFTAGATGVYYIGFQSFSDADKFVLSLDDISVKAAPNCAKPGFVLSTPASYNSVLVRWDSTSATSSGYEYLLNTSAALPDSGTLINAGSRIFNAIIPEKQYYFHVRTVCGAAGTSLWETIPVSIPCTPYPLPYSENFDSDYTLPACMRSENLNDDNYYWQINELASNSAPFSMFYVTDGNANADDWFYTPSFNFTAGVSYRLSFYYKGSLPDVVGKMEVRYGNGNNVQAMTNLLMKDTLINYTSFRKYQTDFIAPATGIFNIGFHAFSQQDQGVVYVDDVNLDVSPNCSEPVNLVVNLINGNQGTVSWSPSTPGTPTGYEYVIDTSSNNPTVAGIATSDNLILLSGLNYFTQYYFHIKTICSDGVSVWVTVPFYTLPNDEPCNALNLILNGPQSCGSTTRATVSQDPPLPVQCLPPNFTVWYKFTPAVNGRVILKTTIPSTNQPLYGSVGWYSLTGNCTDFSSYSLVPGSECSPFGGNGSGDIDSLQSPILTAGTTYYIMISGIDYNWGDFCLNIISQPGNPQIYRFTGNGNWSDGANWENQLIPPAYLPGGDLIVIDNAAGGQCVLNVTQYVSNTGSLIINAGKKIIIPGALKVQ